MMECQQEAWQVLAGDIAGTEAQPVGNCVAVTYG
jgi:hypothetical protein